MNPVQKALALMDRIQSQLELRGEIQDSTMAVRLVDAVREMDFALTGKTENRRRDEDLRDAKTMLESFTSWLVYLSDGGLSRVCLKPLVPDTPMNIVRGDVQSGGSRPEVIMKFDSMIEKEV